jgi:hypothetical protein
MREIEKEKASKKRRGKEGKRYREKHFGCKGVNGCKKNIYATEDN